MAGVPGGMTTRWTMAGVPGTASVAEPLPKAGGGAEGVAAPQQAAPQAKEGERPGRRPTGPPQAKEGERPGRPDTCGTAAGAATKDGARWQGLLGAEAPPAAAVRTYTLGAEGVEVPASATRPPPPEAKPSGPGALGRRTPRCTTRTGWLAPGRCKVAACWGAATK